MQIFWLCVYIIVCFKVAYWITITKLPCNRNLAISWLLPHFTAPSTEWTTGYWNKNNSSWYLFYCTRCKTGEQPWYFQNLPLHEERVWPTNRMIQMRNKPSVCRNLADYTDAWRMDYEKLSLSYGMSPVN